MPLVTKHRRVQFNFELTEDERQKLAHLAQILGLTQSKSLRLLIRQARPTHAAPVLFAPADGHDAA